MGIKRVLKLIAVVIVVVTLLAFGYLLYSTETNRATPNEDAVAALASDERVIVEFGDWLVMRPAASEPTVGFILYPGAHCDIRGYARVLREIAASGYLVVGVSMPFDYSIFAPGRADDVRVAYPDIREWVIAGHSMGGGMASLYAHSRQQGLAGLILWDSHPAESNSFAETEFPIALIHRATPDGTSSQKYLAKKHLFPADSLWVPIPGGNHMNFGSFDGGSYEEEWDASIDHDAQQAIVIAGTVKSLEWMTGN